VFVLFLLASGVTFGAWSVLLGDSVWLGSPGGDLSLRSCTVQWLDGEAS
jgi:hypothetical protein